MQFSSNELADVERSLKRLIFAAQDMVEVRDAAEFLREADAPGGVLRALETAIPVAYTRPWGTRHRQSAIGGLEDHWRPTRPDLLAAHKNMFLLRDKVYAHTDKEGIGERWIHGMDSVLRPSAFIPAWRPRNPDLLEPVFTDLVESQLERFGEGIEELQARLAAHGG